MIQIPTIASRIIVWAEAAKPVSETGLDDPALADCKWVVGAELVLSNDAPLRDFSNAIRLLAGLADDIPAVFDANTGFYLPVEGPINGARLSAFHQLDLRLDKTWILRLLQLTLYADIQNVYNRQNPEFINYAYDYQSFSTINSLPIIPSIGFRVEL